MNKNILKTDTQSFIQDNLTANITKLILKGSPFNEITVQELANQIIAKQKSKKKLPTWYQAKNIYYPQKISIEQSSSELTASYKADLIKGNTIIDVTGGFGVDSYYFSKKIKRVTHCDINANLSEIVNHNLKELNVQNINTININGIDYIDQNVSKVDYIYIDPSRRDANKNKVFFLNDCLPNVPLHLNLLFSKTNVILIKTSPLLDITSALKELQHTKEIHIIAVENEVKELLFILEKSYTENAHIKTINISKKGNQTFNFIIADLKTSKEHTLPKKYLYEPNNAILKSGGFHNIPLKYDVSKLHDHTHLYTSENLIDFPGRSFEIEEILPYNKKNISKKLAKKKANITTRNFPKSVNQLKKDHKIIDGGDLYIFFTTLNNNQKVFITTHKVS